MNIPLWLKVVLSWAGILLLFLGLAEILIRVFSPVSYLGHPPIYETDRDVGYRHTPNIDVTVRTAEYRTRIRTNSLGFRSSEESATSKGSKILVLGDSFTIGLEVEEDERFTEIVGGKIGRPVINMGVSGYDPVNELNLLRKVNREKLIKGVDVVILQFFIGNDFISRTELVPVPTYKGHLGRKAQSVDRNAQIGVTFRRFFKENSHLAHKIMGALSTNQFFFQKLASWGVVTNTIVDGKVAQLRLFFPSYWANTGKTHINSLKQVFIEFKKETEKNNQQFIVLVIPTKYQVTPGQFDWALDEFKILLSEQQYDVVDARANLPNQIISQVLDREGIIYLDMLDKFPQYIDRNESIYFIRDQHLTKSGHRIVADELYKFFMQNKNLTFGH